MEEGTNTWRGFGEKLLLEHIRKRQKNNAIVYQRILFKKVNNQINHWIGQRFPHTKVKSKLTNLESAHLIWMQTCRLLYTQILKEYLRLCSEERAQGLQWLVTYIQSLFEINIIY